MGDFCAYLVNELLFGYGVTLVGLAAHRVNSLFSNQMLTETQCKMARAALGWGVRDLAEKAGISANTVARFENGHHTPNPATLKVIRLAFEAAGVRFIDRGVEPPEAKRND